jgi:hypothetical protein
LPKYNLDGDELTNDMLLCHYCDQGVLYATEILEDNPEEHIVRYYYSCGHKREKIDISVKTGIKTEFKMVSGAGDKKAGKHRESEIEDRFKNNDKDHPGKPTVESYYKDRHVDQTFVFHAVKYLDHDELKHIDCKKCGNDWKYQSGLPLEDFFSFEHNPEVNYLECFKIRCLKCNATYDRTQSEKLS